MSRFLSYNPEQIFLLPPNVKQVLGEEHLCFFVYAVVERLNVELFMDAYSEEGGQLYHPWLMLKVWLYAYAIGLTSARRREQRVREDLAFRYLAGGAQPDFWALNAFRRRHQRGINDAFVQVLEMAQELGLAGLGTVAIDTTRVKASASPDRIEKIEQERQERARKRRQVRRWQPACEADDPPEGSGATVGDACQQLKRIEVPKQLEPLPKVLKRSRSDPDSRFLRERGGRFVLGYTGEIAVSEDHFIVAARVTQNAHDVHGLVPMVDEVERRCRRCPQLSAGRSRVLLKPKRGGVERTWHRRVRAGLEPGKRTARRASGRGSRAYAAQRSTPAGDAAEVANARRPTPLWRAKNHGGTGVWSSARTTRNEDVSLTGPGAS